MYWDTPADWREVQVSLAHHLRIHSHRRMEITELAGAIAGKTKNLDALLEALCACTCPGCEAPCCVRATVRYDLRDLLFLHLIGKGLPLGQPAPRAGRACSCLGKNGCMIDRLMRPFMCTWYLCPSQMALVRSEKMWQKYRLPERLREIQNDRKNLESVFLKLVAPASTSFHGDFSCALRF